MGGALQAIARSSPARGARMREGKEREVKGGAEGKEGIEEGIKEVPGRVGLKVGTELPHHHIWP